MKQILLSYLLLLLLWPIASEASHMRGAYITFTKDSSPTPNLRKFIFTLTIFTDRASAAEDLAIQINNGDGSMRTVARSEVVSIGYNTDRETFTWEHTYPSDGTYMVSWIGSSRNRSVNITTPGAQYSQLIYTTVYLSSFQPNSNSPAFLLPSFAEAYVDQPFKYNLLAYDRDGDSLSYSLFTPAARDAGGNTFYIPGYSIPAGMTINQFGEINWPNPAISGEYSLAVMVKEYRNKQLIGTFLNEVQVIVKNGPQVPEFTLLHKDRLTTSSAGYILARPDVPLKLTFFIKNPAANTLHVSAPVSELLMPHLNNLHTLAVMQRDSADGVVQEILFLPSATLKRIPPYAIGIRSSAGAAPTNPESYKYDFIYLLVGEQKSASSPDLLPQPQLVVYPNPVKDIFTIEVPGTAPSLFVAYGTDGKIVWKERLTPGSNVINRPAGLVSGFYTYILHSQGNMVKRGKLVLQK